MKNMYLCEVCGKSFETEKECKKHEKNCNTDIKIKCISLVWKFNNIKQPEYIIEIVEYQKAKRFNGVYKLCKWYDYTDWQELELDKVIYEMGINKIYTTDFSKETEQKYINLLKTNEQQCIKHDQEILVKQLEGLNNNIQIERKIEDQ